MITTFLKRLFCKHLWTYTRAIHGDDNIMRGWKRSEYKCGKIKYLPAYMGFQPK